MARKRKRRAAAVTTSSKLAAKEAMAITSMSLSALPVLTTSKKKSNSASTATTLLATGKEEIDSRISPAKKLIENSELPNTQSQSLITTASCRRKQAKPQRKNGESYSIHTKQINS